MKRATITIRSIEPALEDRVVELTMTVGETAETYVDAFAAFLRAAGFSETTISQYITRDE
jgi:hypothetical protein